MQNTFPTNKDDLVTWATINNFIPIVLLILSVAGLYFGLQGKLALIEQKVEYVASAQKEMLELYKNTEQRYGVLSLKVQRLETIEENR